MKIPDITQQPVGEFALGNIRQPDYQALGEAAGELIATGGEIAMELLQNTDTEVSEATSEAVKELSELRAPLEESNSMPTEEVPDDIVAPVTGSYLDLKGERVEFGQARVLTHEVADEWWEKRSDEIVKHWAGTIGNREARAKFLEDMTQRYVGPGTVAIGKASIIRRRAYNQAVAENAIIAAAAAQGDKDAKEEEANEIIDRQEKLGADPVWVQRQRAALGPLLDQLEIQNSIAAATSEDDINLIEESMWGAPTRMSPEQLRTMSSQMDIRRREFEKEKLLRQKENAAQMFKEHVVDNSVGLDDVGYAVGDERITSSDGWIFKNSLEKGDTTRYNDPQMLSNYRAQIIRLKYTGNRRRVSDKAELLELLITRASMGLTPVGGSTNLPAPITGTEAHNLIKDLRKEVTAILESDEYDNALKMVYKWTNVAVDLEGQISVALGGNQHQVDAALAFKEGLDNYMDSFGADAHPIEYFHSNRDAFNPNNFADGVNARFLEEVEQARPYITIDTALDTYTFNQEQQAEFVEWLADQAGIMDPAEFQRISTLFGQFYRGQGLAPFEGRLALEPTDPLYYQFEAASPQAPVE